MGVDKFLEINLNYYYFLVFIPVSKNYSYYDIRNLCLFVHVERTMIKNYVSEIYTPDIKTLAEAGDRECVPTSVVISVSSESEGVNNFRAHPLNGKPDIDLIGSIVSSIFKVSEQELFSNRRGKAPVALARQIAMYLMHITCGRSYTEVGRAFGRDRTTVSHACQLIEDKREDPNMDWSLDLMEHSFFSLSSSDKEVLFNEQ